MIELNKDREFLFEFSYDMTLKCNNRCPYCNVVNMLDNTSVIDEDVYNETIKQVNLFVEKYPEYRFRFWISGGEPFLVMDKVHELIERLDDSIDYIVHSNMNYNYSVVEPILRYNNVQVMVSWHLYSKIDRVKRNVLEHRDRGGNVIIRFLIEDNIQDTIYDDARWARDNGIPYVVDSIRSAEHQLGMFTGHDKPEYKELIAGGDYVYETVDGMDAEEMKHITSKYYLVCKANQRNLEFDGHVKTKCGYGESKPIGEGIEPLKVFCKDKTCYYNIFNYKKLTMKR